MEGRTAPYLVERQSETGEPWQPVAACISLIYARKIALAGLRRGSGLSYRARSLRSGRTIPLHRVPLAKAAS